MALGQVGNEVRKSQQMWLQMWDCTVQAELEGPCQHPRREPASPGAAGSLGVLLWENSEVGNRLWRLR